MAEHVGGMCLVLCRTVTRLPMRADGREIVRALYAFGNASLPVVAATAAFTGVIMVLQGALYVRRFGVYDLVGWFTGFATFREIGPVLIGLMFSGRVGASNTSELATMRVNDQLTALEIMAIDVYELLIAPRFVAMMLSMAVLVALGDAFAVGAGALAARILLDLDFIAFWRSLTEGLGTEDFLLGMGKGVVYGALVSVVSTHFALRAQRGAKGVGAAVNSQVVACAIAIFASDYIMTRLGGH